MAGGGANVTHTHTSINTHAHVHTAHTLSHFTPVCVDMETKTHLKTKQTYTDMFTRKYIETDTNRFPSLSGTLVD